MKLSVKRTWKSFLMFVGTGAAVGSLIGAIVWGIYLHEQRQHQVKNIREHCAFVRTIEPMVYGCKRPIIELDFDGNPQTRWVDGTCTHPAQECYLCDGGETCVTKQ
jgi:hypothetical protein